MKSRKRTSNLEPRTSNLETAASYINLAEYLTGLKEAAIREQQFDLANDLRAVANHYRSLAALCEKGGD